MNILDPIPGFNTWFSERSGSQKGGGGLCIIYKESLTAHEWEPSVDPGLEYVKQERQWLLLDTGNERIAFLHVYIACCNSDNDPSMVWNEDLFLRRLSKTL